MAESGPAPAPDAPDQLFHTILRLGDAHHPEAPDLVFPLGTHTDLGAAKDHARIALADLGYRADDFVKFEVRTWDKEDWKHGYGIVLLAKAANNFEIRVGIATTPNNERLAKSFGHRIEIPGVSNHLNYVIHSVLDMRQDHPSTEQRVGIHGVYVHQVDAITAAQQLLAECGKDGSIKRFEQHPSLGEEENDWPYGERVSAYAIESSRRNHYIAIKTVPGTHHWHKKHRTSALRKGERCFTEKPSEPQKATTV